MPAILITGTNRGLGLEFVKQYAADGWKIHATCRNPKNATALNSITGDITVHQLDLTNKAEIDALAQTINEPLDVVLSNAGVIGETNHQGVPEEAGWQAALQTNLLAPVQLAYAFHDHLKRGGEKKLIAITSRMGSIADNTSGGLIPYRTSKAGLNAAWMSLHQSWSEADGIICTVLHPGWVRTDMGGPNGQIDPAESIGGMRQVISGLSLQDGGKFYAFDGRELPW